MRHLLSIDDMPDDDLARFRAIGAGEQHLARAASPLVGLLFRQPSLRTRVGFAAAAYHAGGAWIDIAGDGGVRVGTTGPERLADVVRVASGMTDVLVYRGPERALSVAAASAAPVINAGDDRGHPTQALIDLVAIERFAGPVENLHVAICGDLGSRCAASLVQLLGRIPPSRLTLVAPATRSELSAPIPHALTTRLCRTDHLDPTDVDLLYLPGLPEGRQEQRLSGAVRRQYQVSTDTMTRLQAHAAVLSPMPVIDEIADDVRDDPRLHLFETTDLSVRVRMEVLKWVTED